MISNRYQQNARFAMRAYGSIADRQNERQLQQQQINDARRSQRAGGAIQGAAIGASLGGVPGALIGGIAGALFG